MYKKYKSCRGWIRTTITPSKEVGPAFRRPDNLFMVGEMGFEPTFSTSYLTPVYQTGRILTNVIPSCISL